MASTLIEQMTMKKRKKNLMSLTIEVGLHLQPTKPTKKVNHKYLSDKNIVENRCSKELIPLKPLQQIASRGNPVQPALYVPLLRACADEKCLPEIKSIHLHMIDNFKKSYIVLQNTLVNAYAKCGRLQDAHRLVDSMPRRNVVTWTIVIGAYCKQGYANKGLALYNKMRASGVLPNEFTFTTVVSACAQLGFLQNGKEIHEQIITRFGFEYGVFVGNSLVDMYVKCGSLDYARRVFDKMSQRDVVSWTAMIAGYSQKGQLVEAARLFELMPERNLTSWNVMIAGYGESGNIEEAVRLFEKMPERDIVSWTRMAAAYMQNGHVEKALEIFKRMPERDEVSWNTMITGFVQNKLVEEALKLFEAIPLRSTVSWNAIIAGCAQNGRFDKALDIFQQMRLSGVKPHSDTFASVLPSCANLAALEQGKAVHVHIIKSGYHQNTYVGNALVDFYAKCGNIEDAYKVFDKMAGRNVISWTAIIMAYAIHGFGKEALQIFRRMKLFGTVPDAVTFVGVLTACGHAGLVDDGWRYFDSMIKNYHITPTREHYCCMVDLLSRAGYLREALDFVNVIPVEPDAAVWLSLLGGCRIHNNIKLGEYVTERVLELQPKNVASYVLLSNIYAAAGRWDDIERVRKMMKDMGFKKKPGCSWIEVNKHVYVFAAGDKSLPQMDEINAELERLSGLMKELGYVSNTRFSLSDIEEEQKEHNLHHHSEKLAIAFGLINTSSKTPIRIMKNLRVCGDCHSATKFISKIVEREIIVRDTSRFHHFKNGHCSCNDYW